MLEEYTKASDQTIASLRTVLAARHISQLSRLSLPEIEQLTQQIARLVPAGNVPGLILSGLARLEGRRISAAEQQQHLNMLFRGVREILNRAVYVTFFAGPAAVILGYQKLLQLAGINVDEAFPEGTWQFYVEFGLREDTARHTNETTGFQAAARMLTLNAVDMLTAWLMAALTTLRHYDRLLENEWQERVSLALLSQFGGPDSFAHAYRNWEWQRPYALGSDVADDDFPAYRRRVFNAYFDSLVGSLDPALQAEVRSAISQARGAALAPYLRQMSILARLEPGQHQELRHPYPLEQASVAVIERQHYSLLSAQADLHAARQFAAALLASGTPGEPGTLDLLLAGAGRSAQPDLRAALVHHPALEALKYVPIILNWDQRSAALPLAVLRQTRRGVGDHALTLFFTPDSTVFDLSHIFFDGAWGAALAEIMTNEAIAWARRLADLPSVAIVQEAPPHLEMNAPPGLRAEADRARRQPEAAAESTAIRLAPVMTLRKLLKARNEEIEVTVNDLLLLYRAIHGQRYRPSPLLDEPLAALKNSLSPVERRLYVAVMEELERIRRHNPAILIPIDASPASPRERLYPTTFRNPMTDLLERHDAVLAALRATQSAPGDTSAFRRFNDKRRHYLRMIAAFGLVMRRYKAIALSGQSLSTATIRLLAHVPDSVKQLLNQIPSRFDTLNEIIKGEEVFSNIGRVARGSSLRRFITAKDDNRQKTLAWGVMTDDQDVVHLSLRDFRPHVAALHAHDLGGLADLIARDFLDSYTDGFNQFIRELTEITLASRDGQ